jgi:HEAT repeat protein
MMANTNFKPRNFLIMIGCAMCLLLNVHAQNTTESPYQIELQKRVTQLSSTSAVVRVKAIERLSMMRERSVQSMVTKMLHDPDASVRREAVMYLGINGDRAMIAPLLVALDDSDWLVRQASIVALRTATCLKLPYDTQKEGEMRADRLNEIKSQIKGMDFSQHVEKLMRLAEDDQLEYFTRCDAVRALSRIAGHDERLVQRMISLIQPHEKITYHPNSKTAKSIMFQDGGVDAPTRPVKSFLQACIRAIGRMSQPNDPGEQYLIRLLQFSHWAGYAMDAMLDCGGAASIDAVIQRLPSYGFNPEMRHLQNNTYLGIVADFPESDNPKLSMCDRLPKLYYHGLRVLCQIPLEGRHKVGLRKVSPTILATLPNHYDSTVVYLREPLHEMTAYLLELAGVRQWAIDAAWSAILNDRQLPKMFEHREVFMKLASDNIDLHKTTHPPYASQILVALIREQDRVDDWIKLLSHPDGWIRIDACRALIAMHAKQAAPALRKQLTESPDDASYGVSVNLKFFQKESDNVRGYDEFCDPSPRFKYAWIVALGELGDDRDIPLLEKLTFNDRNVLEVQHAAAMAIAKKSGPNVMSILKRVEDQHPYYSIRMVARDALWRAGIAPLSQTQPATESPIPDPVLSIDPVNSVGESYVFIKGPHDTGNHFQISKDQTGYSTSDSGPTYRFGHNLFIYHDHDGHGSLIPLTRFKNSYVADLEVSYDGESILFCKRNIDGPDPWWHLFEIRRDGSHLRQITTGPYHDVQPVYMPDGRIAFSSTRLGYRDEYHGYPATGLTTIRRDGSDIRVIGYNFGRDAEPSIGQDGRILFTRLELFYSRVKTEWTLMSAFPDGTKPQTLYGPERRELFYSIPGSIALSPPRHRVLRITQPQPFGKDQFIINSFRGPMLVGPGRMKERFLLPNNDWAVTCPYPLSENELLVSAGKRTHPVNLMQQVNPGVYKLNVHSGKLTLVYDDPNTSELDARPLRPRPKEQIVANSSVRPVKKSYTGVMMCNSVFESRQPQIKERAKYIRINEGIPVVERHQTHTNHGTAWRNHGGPIGRILGTIPLANDGSFSIEIPADRLVHFQALDSDRQVIGNEINWQYVRPGDTVSCIGCHEKPDTTPVTRSYPTAFRKKPIQLLPTNDDILYRAKMWKKGWAPDEREKRMRSVNSINTYGRE